MNQGFISCRWILHQVKIHKKNRNVNMSISFVFLPPIPLCSTSVDQTCSLRKQTRRGGQSSFSGVGRAATQDLLSLGSGWYSGGFHRMAGFWDGGARLTAGNAAIIGVWLFIRLSQTLLSLWAGHARAHRVGVWRAEIGSIIAEDALQAARLFPLFWNALG